MVRKLVQSSLSAAVVIFVWTLISWTFLSWHCDSMNNFLDKEEVSSVITKNSQKDGVYFLPSACDIGKGSYSDDLKKGPVIFASINRYGLDVNSMMPYITFFVVQFIGSLFVSYLVLLSKVESYLKGVLFISLIGLSIGILSALPYWIWWGFSLKFVQVEIADFCVSWFFASWFMMIWLKNSRKRNSEV